MCGRFAITLPVEAMAKLFEAMPANDLPEGPNYNVCPTNPVAAVTGEGGMRRLRALRWGFVPHWYKTLTDGPLLINARADTIATKPAFAEAARRRRCLIPASGFYEWSKAADGARLPWYVRRADGAPMAMAGIWQDWEREGQRLSTCAIVTTEANPAMATIHHRMPVIVERADWPLWLGEAGHGAAVLMRPAAEGVLAVNSNRAAGPGLIAPVAT
ncbi:SOS response-associated peptidase [Rhodovulum tesquicola]|uniref:SOS response-associated peptidase n=1 Tax=Rhodovulum tesquicola TaxID=540254 RepID=UPI0020972760|nr:SOS response-associated peptidase [Rhodovulum tesquicola]MCO8144255.1 SOS response-associated peptidase [Rhodovulum tesquicola]